MAIIAAIVGLVTGSVGPVIKHWLDRWSLRHRLSTEHEYAERKKLRSLIGHSHGRVLEAAESLNHRLWNLQENEGEGWLKLDGQYEKAADSYYFRTTIHRMIVLLSYLKRFQEKAVFIDARIAEKGDLLFLKYAKALEWALTDVSLFNGLGYDANYPTDHLFKGHLRVACEVCADRDLPASLGAFEDRLREDSFRRRLSPLYAFFDGLAADGRPRWDRLVAFHLLLCSFINAFGYPMQRTSTRQLSQLAASIHHVEVPQNLMQWLRKLGIGEGKEGKNLRHVLEGSLKTRGKIAADVA
ncbi:MAG: hypothetical protein LAP85_27280 [Acidobacteriia bacterium]|nr:hypothetical protein [Terriglobia bacterium]